MTQNEAWWYLHEDPPAIVQVPGAHVALTAQQKFCPRQLVYPALHVILEEGI